MRSISLISLEFAIALVAIAIGVESCSEPFPPYIAPANVLSASVSLTSPDTVEVFFDPSAQQYFLNSIMILKVAVTNVHDDLLQGKALVAGRITLQSFGETPRMLIVPLSSGNLRSPALFGGNIALGPGRAADFTESRLPYATDGHIVFEGTPYVAMNDIKVYRPIDFIAYADVQLFEMVQPTRTPQLQFSLVFRVVTNHPTKRLH